MKFAPNNQIPQGLTEQQTRQQLIDQQLLQSGWSLAKGNLVEELHLTDEANHIAESRTAAYRTGDEFVDYAMLGQAGKPLGLVEAKRTSRDALAGKRQADDYADRMQARYGIDPFIFLTNGQQLWFWDRSGYPLRQVSGFFTPDDLARLHFQRNYRQPLHELGPNPTIVDRPYQVEAIKRVTEAIAQSRRKFLLVMATGTGKTRTVIALIDLLMRAKWVQRVLFLADRRELVRQALGDFKEHMPNETRARVESGEIDDTARIHIATYPSMMQIYETLSPGYYDLIVADESHRSIYNRYKALLDYFDALQLGLTATPTDYIEHNTFQLFDCPAGLPTFRYDYDMAIEEEYLARYRVLDTQTSFQVEGIKAEQLPPEIQRQLTEQGITLEEIDFEGSDLERRVTNSGTIDAMVQEVMEKCRKDASGTLPAKTILFAMSHAHAVRIWESFNQLYPDLQRRGLVEIIDSHMERAEQMLNDFKQRDLPRIAISVDMLDTGIDVPAIQTLVFAKPVFSLVKFWQMIGRGTRRWTDPATGALKQDFLIIDFWNNFAYFKLNPQGEIASPTEPLPVRLFRLRLEKLLLLNGFGDQANAVQTVAQLQHMIEQTPLDNVNVRPHSTELTRLRDPAAWQPLDATQQEHLSQQIAPLVRFLPDVNLSIMTFAARTERLAIAHLLGDTAEVQQVRTHLLEDLTLLPTSLAAVQAQAAKMAWVRTDAFWQHLTVARIDDLQATFAPLMRYRQRRRPEVLELNLPDEIARRHWILYGPSGEGAFADTYREQVEAAIQQLAREHPTLRKLQRGEELTAADSAILATTLNRPDLYISEGVLQQVYRLPNARLLDFVRHILGLSRLPSCEAEIEAAFERFLTDHPHFTATQIRFLRAIRSAVLRQSRLSAQDLQRPPFTHIGIVTNLFSDSQVTAILEFANRLAA